MYVSEFENYLRNETFLKDETVKAYLRIINKFIAQSDDFNVNDLQSELRNYLLQSMEKDYSISTINSYLTALKQYAAFLIIYFPDESNYDMARFPRKRKEDKLPETLLSFDVERIQFALKGMGQDDPTSELIARLMFNHGLMPKDISAMRIDSIDFQRGMIIYHRPDSNIPRMMVLIKGDFQAFIKYLNSRRLRNFNKKDTK